jgi:hypothetical protein
VAVRRADPYKHKSRLSADASLIRTKADTIDAICDELLQVAKNDTVVNKIVRAKTKALEIVNIIEEYD